MASPYAIRPVCKALLAIALLVSLTVACKKSGMGGADVDPRDQYVGTYEGTYRTTLIINNSLPATAPETGKVQVSVSKAQPANQVYLEILFNDTNKQALTAELTDVTFTIIDKQSEPLPFGGQTYTAKYTAQGQFVIKDKTFVMNTVAETLAQGVTLTRRGDINGTKK